GAGPAHLAVDEPARTPTVEGLLHQPLRFVQHTLQLLVGALRHEPPGRDTGLPERLRLPHIAYTGNDTLVEQHVAELPALVRGAQPGATDALREDVRPEPGGAPALELQDGTVPENRLVLRPAQDEPGTAGALRTGRNDAPAAAHAQVAAHDDAAVE